MNVNNVSITISAVSPAQYPGDGKSEIAFVGRSNVGKSSLINKLVNRKSLARISSKPGKTSTINFYNVEDKIYFVDLPGYGYAKVSKVEKQKWAKMIEEYLSTRNELVQVILLVDSRHAPTEDDKIMLNWIKEFGYNAVIAATKWDKLSNKEKQENLENIKKELQLTEQDTIVAFSAQTGQGKEELWEVIDSLVERNRE
ncbi:ribosome biogenesis GTP-binding protein YihA/YsxC [Petroclostridium sp. X23]|uniref:ribosome biogenesis GTP-binding protein YihA/YsxC n=1 Tax=Petroclostridium sp. X23 TaxID=3045146 RepID=UPI0024ACB54D|nr:ribosome biogenesis GTP-binding protein YihA/YsxC [Petroclostridium sp. X23]WHH60250.1 ribosome biogenesis GTP-binding protein YihA/YsxC [Petroclostridium sp. X23]